MSGADTYRETRDVPVTSLEPFPGNANRGDLSAIRESIRRSGQYRPLIVRQCSDGRMVVLAGNNTLLALRAEGRRTVRCEIHEMDDQTALRVNIGDNHIARRAVVDEDLLLDQLSYLDGDYEGTGLTQGHINAMLGEGGFAADPEHEISGLTTEEAYLSYPHARTYAPGEVPPLLLAVPPEHAATVAAGLDELADHYGTTTRADTLARLVADALSRRPSP